MKYFVQFEGREKLLIRCILLAQIIIILLLCKVVFRPIDLYIGDEQLKEIYSWEKRDLNEKENAAKAGKSLD